MHFLQDIYHLIDGGCVACGRPLEHGERDVCSKCLNHLPRTMTSNRPDNFMERYRFPLMPVQATSYLFYSPKVRHIVHEFKYHGNIHLAHRMGALLGEELAASPRFADVDVILPMPAHWIRLFDRGYNQSYELCRGIAQTFPRPIDTDNLIRHRYSPKQALRGRKERYHNVALAFSVKNPRAFDGKHLLLVDDVLTTGHSLCEAIRPLFNSIDVRVSVATLAVTHHKK